MSKSAKISGGSDKESEIVKQAFDLFDVEDNGKVDPKELKSALKNMEFDQNHPEIFQIFSNLDTPAATKRGGITFDDLISAVNKTLLNKETKASIRSLFNVFVDESNEDAITPESIQKNAKALKEELSSTELSLILDRLSKNRTTIEFDEFYDIMTKDTYY